MKKIFNLLSAIIVLLALGSCADNAMTKEPQAPTESTRLNNKIKRAIDLANAEMDRFFPAKSRAGERKPAIDAIGTISEVSSRSGEDTLIYVVNYADNGGYALVSARDNVDPVLAVVPEGNYNPEVGSNNPGFNIFLEAAKEHVKAAREVEITPDPGNQYIIENGKYVKYEKDITHWGGNARMGENHHWSQKSIYGDLCPNGTTGCGPLAMASIITYLRCVDLKTDRIYYTYPNRDIEYEDIDWEQLFKHKHEGYTDKETGDYHYPLCFERDTAITHTTIARFCRQLGHDADADYKFNPNETSTYMKSLKNTLQKYMPEFTVSKVTDFKSYTTMRLIDRGLLLMNGKNHILDSGHAWVCDGYDYHKTVTTRYESDVPEVVIYPIQYNWVYAGTSVYESSKNHMLWGWGGLDDGWYSGDVFETTTGSYTNFKYISVTKGL